LPVASLVQIFSHFSCAEELGLAAKTCRKFRRASLSDSLWKFMCKRDFYHLDFDDIEEYYDNEENSWRNLFISIQKAFPVRIEVSPSSEGYGVLVVSSDSRFFPNLSDQPDPPASLRTHILYEDVNTIARAVHMLSDSAQLDEYHSLIFQGGLTSASILVLSKRRSQDGLDFVEVDLVPYIASPYSDEAQEIASNPDFKSHYPIIIHIPWAHFVRNMVRILNSFKRKCKTPSLIHFSFE